MNIIVEQPEGSMISSEKVKALCENIINGELSGKEFELQIQFIDESQMTELNNEYRSVNKPTDVLSFPVFENKKEIEKDPAEYILLGNIFICEEYILETFDNDQSQTLEHLGLALAHGTLHCIGYTHDTDEEEAVMNKVQQIYLQQTGEGAK